MAYTATRFYQGQLSATLTTTLATVPGGKKWIVKDIQIVNTDTATRQVTIRMPGSSAGAEIFDTFLVLAKESVQWSGHVVLSAAETITGGADVASKVSVTISGAEG